MYEKLNFLERVLLELDVTIGMVFAPFEFGKSYRKYNGLYCLTPFQRKRIAIISRHAANRFYI